MYTCSEGHETNYVTRGDDVFLVVNCLATGKILHKIKISTDHCDMEEIQESLDGGECPVCDNWELISTAGE